MTKLPFFIALVSLAMLSSSMTATQQNAIPSALDYEMWLTLPDKSILFQKQSKAEQINLQPQLKAESVEPTANPTIQIDISKTYQQIDGFGYALTGGSALHIYKMTPTARKALLTELFDTTGNNVGVSYLRISVGSSDLDEFVFSYDDMPAGQTDPQLKNFSLGYSLKYLVPLIKEILEINPKIKILGSPWSPPAWMKTNNSPIGGNLRQEYFTVYAQYLAKYIQAMKQQGISIDAITVQNQPLNPKNNPSMYMTAEQQGVFIKRSLGPVFRANNITTKIILYDHNADRVDYPMSILNDADARNFIDGSAFHLYAGSISSLTALHNAFPNKNLYFTEQWIGAPGNFPEDLKWHTRELVIGATRNWCKTVLEWNLAADEKQQPHTNQGGCIGCLGALTITGDAVKREPAYYIIAHASKFVRPGSVRTQSNYLNDLPNVAFKTQDGKIILIVLNDSKVDQQFTITVGGQNFSASIKVGAVETYVFFNKTIQQSE